MGYTPFYCSIRWLKIKFKHLGLCRRHSNPPDHDILQLIEVYCQYYYSSLSLLFNMPCKKSFYQGIITKDQLIKIFKEIRFSEKGSNQRYFEEKAYTNFLKFIYEIESELLVYSGTLDTLEVVHWQAKCTTIGMTKQTKGSFVLSSIVCSHSIAA